MRPLDPAAGPVQRFACELRALRAAAGELPFWKMARRCEVSKTTLAAAVAGYQLPSERVVREFIGVCGGDWQWWRERRLQAAGDLLAGDPEDQKTGVLVLRSPMLPVTGAGLPGMSVNTMHRGSPLPDPPGHEPGHRRSPRLWLGLAVLTSVLVAVLAWTSDPINLVVKRRSTQPSNQPLVVVPHVEDGTDPKVMGCGSDRMVLATAVVALQHQARLRGRILRAGTNVGTVTLAYSRHCGGAWPRFDPTPGLNPDPNDTTVGELTIEGLRPADHTRTLWQMGHIEQTYGDLLLTGMGCVFARVRIDMVGQNVAATGQTPCLPHM